MSKTETKPEKDDLKENGNGDYKPANPQGKTVHIEGLKDMKMAELTKLARDMDIQGASAQGQNNPILLQQALGRDVRDLEPLMIDLRGAARHVLVAEGDALIADEQEAGAGDQLGHLVLRLQAEGAIVQRREGCGACSLELAETGNCCEPE